MYRVFFFVALLLPTAVYAQSGWYELSSGVGATLNDVAFTTVDRGYAVGDSGTAIRTSDGGQTWQSMEMPAPVDTTAEFQRVVFTSQNVGYIVGSDRGRRPGFDYGRPIILRTVNGGATWDASVIEAEGKYEDIQFVTPDIGYVVGLNKFTGAIFARTTNGGTSWNMMPIEQGYTDHNLFVEFRDTNVGMMSYRYQSGSQQVYGVLQTSDGGERWEFSTLGSQPGAYGDIHYVGDQIWLVAYGGVYRTEDDGKTWQRVYSSGGRKFGFADKRVGYAVSGSPVSMTIIKTTDGGVTWSAQGTPDDQYVLYGISAPGLNIAYAVGSNGVILKTVDGGGTPVGVEERREREERLRIDPVPTRGSVRCGYGVRQEDRRLEVVDILGRVVMEQKIAAGSSETVIETWELSAGVYVCRLGDRTAIMVVTR